MFTLANRFLKNNSPLYQSPHVLSTSPKLNDTHIPKFSFSFFTHTHKLPSLTLFTHTPNENHSYPMHTSPRGTIMQFHVRHFRLHHSRGIYSYRPQCYTCCLLFIIVVVVVYKIENTCRCCCV